MLACAIRRSAGLPVVSSNDDENDWVCHFVTQPQDRWQQHQSRGPRRPEQRRPGISKPARKNLVAIVVTIRIGFEQAVVHILGGTFLAYARHRGAQLDPDTGQLTGARDTAREHFQA